MSAEAAAAKAQLFAGLGARAERAWFVPGRIELLGKHTDYAGGRSLLCAVERGFCVAASPRRDRHVQLTDARTGERAAFTIGGPLPGNWARYPATVAQRLAADGRLDHGADIIFASDLPAAAGMSSSSAFIVASFLALADGAQTESREVLAVFLASAEVGVGTHGGSEDHTAILCCEAGRWSQYRFCPTRLEHTLAAPAEMALVIGVSGVTAAKAGAARVDYNRAAAATAEILSTWNEASGRQDATLAAALAAGAYEPLLALLPDLLRARLEQFHHESDVWIPAAAFAAREGDWQSFGEFVACSQAGAEAALGNQIPETVALAASARRLGAVAASAFGAGFGGSVWALARRGEAAAFRAAWQREYQKAFAARAGESLFFESAAGPAALQIELEG